jgi:DNA-binding CsgD family transcriptional regulator/tetratricopeptide (TPR) repeat protein
VLVGRGVEREALDHLLDGAQRGSSATTVLCGEAGVGKTALLQHVRDAAARSGFRVVAAAGVESEAEFAFAGLHQVCAPLLERAGALPEPQQAALGVALGMRAGPAPDRFLVGLAVLTLLAEVAEDAPLLCLVDDAQWLDRASAQVLAFVARRLAAERIAWVVALRDPGDHLFAGLPELRLDGLGDADARALLASAVHAPLDDEVRDRIVAEARGNPLALLEMARGAPAAELAGGYELRGVLDVPQRIEDGFRRRSAGLPADTQALLLVAAAEPTGDAALLWRAAAHLGIARGAAEPAEAAGLVEIGTRVRFSHPLVRCAVYRAAALPDVRRAHGALAVVTDPQVDPDRRTWHRAQAVLGTDEEVAAELERSAGRARARGGLAAAAAFLARATELTPGSAARARRALDAAHVLHRAGASEAARDLLGVAAAGPWDALQHARLELLRARIGFHLARGNDVLGPLLEAARALAPLDAALSRETYLHALDAAVVLGASDGGRDVLEVADAARAAPPPPGPPTPADLVLDGLVTTFTQGYAAGVPGLRRAVEAFRGDLPPAATAEHGRGRQWLWLASRIAFALFDDGLADVLTRRSVQLARDAGALADLPLSLVTRSVTLVFVGELARAEELAVEEAAITRATGAVPLHHARLAIASWRGRRAETVELRAAIAPPATGGRAGTEVTWTAAALAVLHNGEGDYPAALDAAARACQGPELPHSNLALPELVEAASRAGRPQRAVEARDELDARARASGTEWALGLAARSRALTSTGPVAEEHYREAVERLGNCRMVAYLARTHLVYGEWLRREGRRQDAREQLRAAHELLSGMGAEAFAARAARELRATGEHPRTRTARPTDVLTAQELHVARLVATGATSREVAAQLFLSPRTVEAHLRSVFRKLGITSRRQLRELPLP